MRLFSIPQLSNHTSSPDQEPNANGFLPEGMPIIQDGEPIWKVLVFDNLGRDVISSVMRVNDLRSCGITIHLYVEDLQSICGVTAYVQCVGT
jgi:sec1 family domain-containing protein 1